jgi:putative heme-binding domain-containing protein
MPRRLSLLVASWILATAVCPGSRAAEPVPLSETLAREPLAALAAEAITSGDAGRGALVFHLGQLNCTKCHVAGAGQSPLGPDLAGPRLGDDGMPLAGERLPAHLVESLLAPSQSIQPAYRGTTIVTEDGRSVTGIIVRETSETVVLRDLAASGGELAIPLAEIAERVPSQTSLMPPGLVNLLADRQQFLDLVKYLHEIAMGGAARAAALRPDPALWAWQGPAAYETTIDHAGFIRDWSEPAKAREAFARGEKIYARVCVNCHGTLDAPGSLPTALRFAEGKAKTGADPYAMYRTLTEGAGQMVAQSWMVPSQKYDVIHYIREAFLKARNPSQYVPITPAYLVMLPTGDSRGPAPSTIEPWRIHDYGPFLAGTIEAGTDGTNLARKGLAIRLDPGGGGVGRGRVWILHELDTLRTAAIWSGEQFIDWRGINFDGSHGTHPRVVGRVMAAVPTGPAWADPDTGSFADPRPLGRDGRPYGPLPKNRGHFTSLHHAGDAVVLEYVVGDTQILETARLEPAEPNEPVVTRIWRVAPHDHTLQLRVASVRSGDAPTAARLVPPADGATLAARDGFHVLSLPPRREPLVIAVALSATETAIAARPLPPPVDPATLIGRPARNPWGTTLQTTAIRGTDGGPFATDVLTPPTSNPWNAQLRFGGLDFLDRDTAAVCTWDGDVWTVSGLTVTTGRLAWRRIATGLFQPLGIKVIDGVIHVSCRDRIVVLRDLDADGCTDRYDTFNTDHQVTEHFHEFAMGLETDTAGNLYYAKSARHALPAVVPHHGTLLKVSRDGRGTEIVARGFRAANGVCVEPDGTFFVTDQEGHWNPKNRINHVRPGGFYGNMFGFHDVTDASDAAMDPPLAWITNAFDRSPAELLRVPAGAWQPLAGTLLELSYGEGRIHLVLPQTVPAAQGGAPRLQGGLVQLPMPDLPTGVMRGRFAADGGSLYACGLFAWAGNKTAPGGLFRIRRTPQPLRMPLSLTTTDGGFRVEFSDPLGTDAAAHRWSYASWGLKRSQNYGSRHIDEHPHAIESVDVSSDGRVVTLRIADFAPTWCYELRWDLPAADGTPVSGRIHGTVHAPGPSTP